MASLKIDFIENKLTSTGKEFKEVTFSGDKRVNCFPWKYSPSFYASLTPGNTIEGTLTKDGKYNVLIEENAGDGAPSIQMRPSKNAGIAQAQQTKKENIEQAMSAKEHSIKESSTFRDATTLAVAELGSNATEESLKEAWKKWRLWLKDNYELGF